MKLPDFPGPGSVPAPDTRELQGAYYHLGEERGQLGHAIQYAGGALRELGTEIAVVSSQVQHIDAVSRVAEADAKAKQKVANRTLWTKDQLVQEFGGEANIPQAIKDSVGGSLDQLTPSDDPNVEATPTGKSDIPGWAANALVYEKDMRKAVDAAAEGITLPGWRNEFRRQMHETLTKEVSQQALFAQKEMYQYLAAKAFVTADHLARNGQVDAGIAVLQMTQGIPQATVEKEKERILTEAGNRAITDPYYSGDRQYIQSTIDFLKGQENEGFVQDGNGNTEKVNVSAVPIIARRKAVSLLEHKLKELDTNDAKLAKVAHDEAMEKYKASFDTVLVGGSPGQINAAYYSLAKELGNGNMDSKTWEHIDGRYKAVMEGLDKKDKKLPPDPMIGTLEYLGNQAARQFRYGGGDGTFNFQTPDGTVHKFDIRDPELGNEMLRLGANPKDVSKLQDKWDATIAGKPVSDSREERIIHDVLKPKNLGAEEAAQTTQAINLELEAQTKQKGKPLTDKEIRDTAFDILNGTTTLTDPNTLAQSSQSYLKEVPADQRVMVAKARQAAGRLYGPGKQGVVKFHRDAQPIVNALNDLWPETIEGQRGGVRTPEDMWMDAARILAADDQLTMRLRFQHKEPTPEAKAYQYLYEHGQIINNKIFRKLGWAKEKTADYPSGFPGYVTPKSEQEKEDESYIDESVRD